jgi:hypothetical protein
MKNTFHITRALAATTLFHIHHNLSFQVTKITTYKTFKITGFLGRKYNIYIYMKHFKKMALDSAQRKLLLWLHYVADTFVLWPHGSWQLQNYCSRLNSLRTTTQFTTESESGSVTPFLDVMIIVWPWHSYLNWLDSYCMDAWKKITVLWIWGLLQPEESQLYTLTEVYQDNWFLPPWLHDSIHESKRNQFWVFLWRNILSFV